LALVGVLSGAARDAVGEAEYRNDPSSERCRSDEKASDRFEEVCSHHPSRKFRSVRQKKFA